ncbi:lactate utilization protein [Pseudodesulfovibrio sp. JC047]|uniref:lactate utilization protein n=1 Tax=Pseudodesulfovibrio sp. JC047 TaxID=2683199 RepID=UPI0013CFDB4E|nr:lactate utilization protein [Pseudodesulfovibrio sp. JC047]NDV20731.1 lactate utilization protein [Pseudodesulfovibrio sp. JC047]
MKKSIDTFWELNLGALEKQLVKNGFDVYQAESADAAKRVVLEEIFPQIQPKSVSWGGSATFASTGLHRAFRADENLEVLNVWKSSLSSEESAEMQRQALLVDCFFCGTNAITEDGCLVNLDMVGNRVGGITFGPRNVVILASRNKVVPDLQRAMDRIKEYVAPMNAMRLGMKTPCAKTGRCMDCDSPDRICNVWTISEKSYPKGRIKVVLINEDLGL